MNYSSSVTTGRISQNITSGIIKTMATDILFLTASCMWNFNSIAVLSGKRDMGIKALTFEDGQQNISGSLQDRQLNGYGYFTVSKIRWGEYENPWLWYPKNVYTIHLQGCGLTAWRAPWDQNGKRHVLADSLVFPPLGWHLPSSTQSESESKANIGKFTWYIPFSTWF